MNLREHEELLREVDELITKGLVRESMSPSAVLAVLDQRRMVLGVCALTVGL